jgi:2-polyprenyl-3-methyl-5-hydroxy-6-metoxy-1,4-benzoquinol methylase
MALARRAQFRVWHLSVRARTLWHRDIVPDPNRTYWIDPKRIQYAVVLRQLHGYDKYRLRGRVITGDWDKKIVPFTEAGIGVFQGLHDRFVRGLPWEDTELYKKSLLIISAGTYLWGCKNKIDLDERCRGLDLLFHRIRLEGYKPQNEITENKGNHWEVEDEISIRIGRDGDFLFEDGQHRLAIAKLLNLKRIPVKITCRHSRWYRFRKEVLEYARRQPAHKLYHPVTHPDLSDIPSTYGDERFEIIKAHLPFNGGDLLDIGAHWGYFCHRFEEERFTCYAVESHAPSLYFMERLKVAENRRFTIIPKSIFDYTEKTDFDVVLALNIFHHFIKAEKDFHRLIDLLRRLRTRVIFFQTEKPDSIQMKGAYRNFDYDEFVRFILEHSNLREAVQIGKTDDGRPLYRFQA